jgi:probable phosphoglycerate mutase
VKTTLLLARHGNTFKAGDVVLRVGARTDLPLIEANLGTALGMYLKQVGLVPDAVYAAPLKRTMQTAEQILQAIGIDLKIITDKRLIEIDYGPDEGKSEEEVIARLGREAIERWNKDAIPPNGWHIDVNAIVDMWHKIAQEVEELHKGQKILIVTSNGILRFSPYITRDFNSFSKEHDIKVATGGLCVFEKPTTAEDWVCTAWNLRPPLA